MAHGRLPLPDPEKRKSRERTVAMTDLERPAAGAKARKLPGSSGYLPVTRRWWKTLATSPQASQFLETDWLQLETIVAPLFDAFQRETDAIRRKNIAQELRLQLEKFGTTPVDRLRLRWRLVEAEREEERAQRPRRRARDGNDPRLAVVEGGKGA